MKDYKEVDERFDKEFQIIDTAYYATFFIAKLRVFIHSEIERAEKEGYDKAIAMFKLKIGFHSTLKSFYKRTNSKVCSI